MVSLATNLRRGTRRSRGNLLSVPGLPWVQARFGAALVLKGNRIAGERKPGRTGERAGHNGRQKRGQTGPPGQFSV